MSNPVFTLHGPEREVAQELYSELLAIEESMLFLAEERKKSLERFWRFLETVGELEPHLEHQYHPNTFSVYAFGGSE